MRIKSNAPAEFKLGAIGSVVSLYEVKTSAYEEKTGIKMGTVLIRIETPDGIFMDVPIEFVSGLEETKTNQ